MGLRRRVARSDHAQTLPLAEIERHRAEPPTEERWILGEVDGPGGRAIVLADAALKRIDQPFADQHVAITVVLEDRGLPDDALAAELNAEDDDLQARMAGTAVDWSFRSRELGLG